MNLTCHYARPHKCEWPGCRKAFNQKGQLVREDENEIYSLAHIILYHRKHTKTLSMPLDLSVSYQPNLTVQHWRQASSV
jgi:hypothetical protein